MDHGADACIGKDLDQQGMRLTPVDEMGAG